MKTLTYSPLTLILAACLPASVSSPAPAEAAGASPTHKDIAYDDAHAAQKLDVYLADSDEPMPAMVYIHGGGWRAGSKNHVPGWLMKDNIVPIKHARDMHERLQNVGAQTELVIVEGANHGVAGAGPRVTKRASMFVREQLRRP